MVFITGATGLVGANLVYKLFNNNEDIKALYRNNDAIDKLTKTLKCYTNSPEKVLEKIQWIKGDILNLELLQDNIEPGMDVYHCAALVSFNKKDKQLLQEVNVQGTANVVNICLEKNVRKLCHVSSIGALGSPVNGNSTDIDSPWSPSGKSEYSISKHNSELEVWRGIAEGLNAVIVNPAVILGVGDWKSGSASLFSRIAKGMKYFTLGTTGYVDVKDVVSAMLLLMQSEISGQQFILSAESLSYKDVFVKIAKALHVEEPKKYASPKLTSIIWKLEKLRVSFFGGSARITKNTHKIAHSLNSYNGKSITEAVEFSYNTIDSCIKEVCNVYSSTH